MPNHKRTQDKTLPTGSVVCWSRRADPYVPVICGSCRRERTVLSNNTTRKTFTGICRPCERGAKWCDETLHNNSIVFWSRREGQQVPVQCGTCKQDRVAHAANIRTETFTGLCRSCLHTGPSSTTWRGGRVNRGGYILVKVYPDHPLFATMATSMGYIPEHRLVMAESLGRPLKRTEVVHHRNGIKTDNRIENLELFASFREHGRALHDRRPHEGFFPVAFMSRIFMLGLEVFLQSSEHKSDQMAEDGDPTARNFHQD